MRNNKLHRLSKTLGNFTKNFPAHSVRVSSLFYYIIYRISLTNLCINVKISVLGCQKVWKKARKNSGKVKNQPTHKRTLAKLYTLCNCNMKFTALLQIKEKSRVSLCTTPYYEYVNHILSFKNQLVKQNSPCQ